MKQERPIATAIPFHPQKERFLLLKRTHEADIQSGKWNFPGGHIDDEKARNAALRELKEETALNGEVLRSGDSFIVENEDGCFSIHPFLVLVGDEPELNKEHTDYSWIEPEDLSGFETVDGLKQDLEAVGVLDD